MLTLLLTAECLGNLPGADRWRNMNLRTALERIGGSRARSQMTPFPSIMVVARKMRTAAEYDIWVNDAGTSGAADRTGAADPDAHEAGRHQR